MTAIIKIRDETEGKKEQIRTHRELKETQEKDIQTYNSMIQEIDSRLNNTGFKIKRKRSSTV